MSLNWPIPSFIGEQYTYAGSTWEWNGEAWQSLGPGSPGPTGATGPTGIHALLNQTEFTLSSYNDTLSGTTYIASDFGSTGANYTAVPCNPQKNITLTSISFYQTANRVSEPASNVQLAIYDDSNLYPNSLIENSSSISITTTGIKTWTLSTPRNFNAGSIFWIVIQADGGNTANLRVNGDGNGLIVLGLDSTYLNLTSLRLVNTTSFGVWNDPFPAGATKRRLSIPYYLLTSSI